MRIKEIKLKTQRLNQMITFYTEQVQLSIIHQTDNSVSFEIGESILTFLATDKMTYPYHFAINIPSHSVLECYHYYKKSLKFEDYVENPSLEIPIYDFSHWKAEALYFFDPDQNIVEFIAREGIQTPLVEKFSSKQLLSVSEMGIVLDDCLESAKELKEKYKIPSFIYSEGSAAFKPIGTDNGLLILVRENRVWYASDFLAKKQFCGVKFESGGEEFEVTFS